MAVTVTFNGTNVTKAESGDSAAWDDDGSGPGSGQSGDLPIQGIEARGRRVDNADKGFSYDSVSGSQGAAIDISALGTHVGYWVVALQPALTTRGSVKLGGGIDAETSPTYRYDRFDGTKPYPATGGWQRVWLDVYRTADNTLGTLDRSSVRQFGVLFNMGDVGGTTPNVQQDRTDYLSGGGAYLTVTGGTSGTPATIDDVVSADPDTSANVYGCVTTIDGEVFLHARLEIEDVYTASDETIIVANQPLAAKDWIGITVDLQTAGDDFNWTDSTYKSSADAVTSGRLGDLATLGNTGTADPSGCTFGPLRRIKLTSGWTFAGSCVITNSGQIDPTNSDYTGEMDLPATDEYVDTQENLDLSSTSGDFEIIMRVAADDWTPASTMALASHYGGSIATESFRLQLLTTTVLRLIVSDGSAETTLDSNALSVIDTEWRWIRVTYDQSAGQASFYESSDPADTPPGDIEWTARGTPTGTSRSIPSLTRIFLIGAENDSTPASFFSGKVAFAELWIDGFRTTGATEGDLIFRADWRTGPDFTGTPSTRADDFDTTGLTWEEQGTAPVYTQGDNNGATAADLDGTSVKNSTSEAALFWNANTDPNGELDNMSFTSAGTGHAMEFGPNTPSSITLTGHDYTGYAATDGSTGNEVLYNNSGKAITINAVSGEAPTVRNGTGASTTVSSPKTASVHVEDKAGSNVQGAQVHLARKPKVIYTSGAGNTAGDADLVITQTIPGDVPQVGRLEVFDFTYPGGLPQTYRWASHDGANTFTLRSEVTYNCTGGGTSTSLQDTVNDFTALDIEEGDAIRNTTDGSWAVVKEIVDANSITTSPLRGGSDNTWTSGDTYSLHRLATTLVSGTDLVDIPYINAFTDASGDISANLPVASAQAVSLRVRWREGATKYRDFVTSGNISATTGFSANVVLDVDEVYTP